MNLKFNTNLNSIRFEIPYNVVSTCVDELKTVFQQLDDAFEKHPNYYECELNLEGARMIDSAGLNFVISFYKYLEKLGCKVKIKASDKNIVRTFRFARVDQFVEVQGPNATNMNSGS